VNEKRSRVPHPLALLTGCVLLAAAASWVLPAGEFDRRLDEATGRNVVVAGTYHEIDPSPVGPFDAIIAIPVGMAERADVIFLVFLVGGAFFVFDETGTPRRAVGALVRAMRGRDLLVIPAASLFFAFGGMAIGMQEEIVALMPLLLVVAKRLGFTPLVAVGMSFGPAIVAGSFGPINPFGVLIAQSVAELRPGSGLAFRMAFMLLALALWVGMTVRLAGRTRTEPDAAHGHGPQESVTSRDLGILAIVAVTFGVVVWGLQARDWDFSAMSACFFLMATLVGLIAGLGLAGTAETYVRGFREMAYAGLLIGFAGGITVVLNEGHVIDTVVNGIFIPLEGLPKLVSALGMMVAHAAVHVPVPSTSGQAILTMPVLVPVSDLLELPRQVTVLAYQYGGVLFDLVTPTNGALLAILASAGVRYDDWLWYMLPIYVGLVAIGAVAIAVGIAVGLS
jgi:uncharacterized ion transporter superfamily protein YfcC